MTTITCGLGNHGVEGEIRPSRATRRRWTVGLVASAALACGATARAGTAVPASDFLDSIGVCTHMSQGIDNPTQVASCLTYAGIRSFRDDGSSNPTTIQKWIDVGNASGALACILPLNGNVAGSIAMYQQVAQNGVLLAVEGPNEPNNWPVNYLGQYSGGTKLTTTTAATVNTSARYTTSYATVKSGTWGYGPVNFKYGSGTAFVTGQTPGVIRNDYTGWMGYKFTVGASAISVTQLGRWVLAGNTGTHAVRLARVSDSAVLGSVSVATAGATAGTYQYATLATPITLAANTAYYVMTQETSGGDSWCDGNFNSLPIAWFCRDLYAAAKLDPILQDYPVFASSEAGGSEPNNVGLQYLTIPTPLPSGVLMPAGTVYADFANTHNYVCTTQPQLGIRDNQCWLTASPGTDCIADGLYKEYGHTWWSPGYDGYTLAQLQTLPRVTTETGWVTQGTNAITEEQQGRLFLNLYLAAFKRNWGLTFIYMLRDDPSQGYWGLFRTDYTPKASATYLHNMTTILADSAQFSPGSVDYSIANPPATVHDLLLQKGNGTYFLAVWNERASGSDTVTVNLGGTAATVKRYDPTLGTGVQQTLNNIGSVALTLSDHPAILEISGYVQTDATPPTTPQNLAATAVSSSQINLTWSASTDNVGVGGYDILRNGLWIGESPTPSYSDTGLSPSTSYTYHVAAFDAADNSSANSAPASATTQSGTSGLDVVHADFVSNGSNQTLNGTQIGLATNLPGGNWIWGAGWNWGAPYVPATWMGGVDKNVANLSEEKTALGVSLASAGSYTKPTEFTIEADLRFSAKGGGLGFWSAMPARTDGLSPFTGFTGIYVDVVAGTLRLYANGTAQGTAVSVGTLNTTTYYHLSYDVNTASGAIGNVMFAGLSVGGLTSSAFTGSATAFAGALSGASGRVCLDNFAVTRKPVIPVSVVDTDFVSNGSNQTLNGTQIGLPTNLPGGNWIWGAGWNWGAPYVPATWMGGVDKDVANLSEEKTALGVSLASAGSYTKPTEFTLEADLRCTAKGGGLGFWSAMPARTDGLSSFTGFTGIYVDVVAGTLRLYANGTAQGTAVSVGTLSTATYYHLSYDVNTASGAIGNVMFAGLPVGGLSSSAFTGSATAFAGALSGASGRVCLDNFAITSK